VLEKELDAASRSRAFDGYELLPDEDDDSGAGGKLHTLDPGLNDGAGVSAVAWGGSPVSPVLAVTYEHAEHSDWCDHSTSLAIWYVSRRDFDPGAPHRQLEASCCLTAVRFHPQDPALILAGGFTGEVFLWSVAKGSDDVVGGTLVASSNMRGHTEKVTSVYWILKRHGADTTFAHTRVLSAALDGKIIEWSVDSKEGSLKPVKAMPVAADHLPRVLKVRARSKTEVGITCLALNSEDPNIAIAGTEAGSLFQCDLSSAVPLSGTAADGALDGAEWRDPVTVTFTALHRGRVLDVACSPYHRDIFLSLGSDMEIKIFSLLSPQAPISIIHLSNGGASAAIWSPSRPTLLAAACQDGGVRLLDAGGKPFHGYTSEEFSHVHELRASERQIQLTSVALSRGSSRQLAAAGDALGRVHVWRVGADAASARPQESK